MTRQLFLGLFIVLIALPGGCGKKEGTSQASTGTDATPRVIPASTEQVATSNEVANKLFYEAMQVIIKGSAAGPHEDKSEYYEKAIEEIHKILKEHPESEIARRVKSNQKLFMSPTTGRMNSLAQFKDYVNEVREGERDVIVNLPVGARNQTLANKDGDIVKISIRKSGAYVIMNKTVNEEMAEKMMKEAVAKKPGVKVLIHADKEAMHLYGAKILSICKSAGVKEAHIAVKTLR